MSNRPSNIEPIADSVHCWLEFNQQDAVLIVECKGGPRDGLAFGIPWDRKQARVIGAALAQWCSATPETGAEGE